MLIFTPTIEEHDPTLEKSQGDDKDKNSIDTYYNNDN